MTIFFCGIVLGGGHWGLVGQSPSQNFYKTLNFRCDNEVGDEESLNEMYVFNKIKLYSFYKIYLIMFEVDYFNISII